MKILIFILIFAIRLFAETGPELEKYLNIIQQDPRNYQAYLKMGLIYINQSNYGEAKKNFEQAITLNNNSYEAYYNLGVLLYQQNNVLEAIKSFKQAYLINKTSDVYINIVNCFIKLKSYDFALKSITEALNEYKNDYRLLNTAGVIALLKNNFTASKEYFTSALKIRDDNKIKSNLAIAEYYLGNKSNAKQTLKNLRKDLNLFNENFEIINKATSGK